MSRAAAALLVLLPALARAGGSVPPTETVLVPAGAEWAWLEGVAPPSKEPLGWTEPGFDDSAWKRGPSGFGYGDDDDATVLSDMAGRVLTLYVRKELDVEEPRQVAELVLSIRWDDGFVAYLNGREVARRGLAGHPPAFDEKASDHEATTAEDIVLPRGPELLARGRNVLAIEVHNSSLHSSDLSLIPELRALSRRPAPQGPEAERNTAELPGPETVVGPLPPAPRTGPAPRFSARTQQAFWWSSNYFEARGSQPRVEVRGLHVREEVTLRPRRRPALALTLRADGEFTSGIGSYEGLWATLDWRHRSHHLTLDLPAKLDRPAYQIAGRILDARDTGALLQYAWRGPRDLEWSGWLGQIHERVHADPTRDHEDLTAGASLRFLRSHAALSPEVGLERTERQAGQARYEYDEWRSLLRLTSSPVRRLYLSGLLRYAERRYAAATGPTAGRRDYQRTGRILAAWQATHLVSVTGYCEIEEGDTNAPEPAFHVTTLWAGLTFSY